MTTPTGIRNTHIIITVHGIRTYGPWQKNIQKLIQTDPRWEQNDKTKEILHYKFGVFTLLSFIVPFLRRIAVNQFRRYLESVFEGRTCERVDIIAHSFGTFLVTEALASPKISDDVKIHTAILCGSAVSPNRDLSRLVGADRRVGRLVNDCGTLDNVLLLTIPVFGIGMAGRLGFQGLEGNALHNRYHVLGHSGYFERHDRRLYDGFIQRWWLPLLLSDSPVAPRDRRPRDPSFADRAWRFLGENGNKVALTFYGAVLAGLGWIVIESREARHLAAERQRQAQLAQSRFLAEQAQDMVRRHDYADAIAAALEGLPDDAARPGRPLVTQAADALWTALLHYPARATLSGHGSGLIAAAYSPDGARVLTGGYDGARLWDGESGQLVTVLKDEETGWRGLGTIDHAAFSLDGKQVATASRSGMAWLWNSENGELLARLKGHTKAVSTVMMSADQDEVLTASSDGTARIWDRTDGTERLKVELKGKAIRSAAYAPLGQSFATASEISITGVATKETVQGSAHIWNNEDGQLVAAFESPSGLCQFALFSPDGKILAVGEGSDVALWDVEEKRRLHVISHDEIVTTAAFSPNGELFLTVSGARARVREAKAWQFRYEVSGDWGQFSPDGTRLVTTAPDKGVARIWSAETGRELTALKGHAPSSGMAVAFSGDGRRLVTASDDASARLWNSEGGSLSDRFNIFDREGAPRIGATQLEFVAGGRRLVTTANGRKHLWEADSGRSIESIPDEFRYARVHAFSPDGTRVVTADFGGTAELREVARDGSLAKFPGKGQSVPLYGAVLSGDGRRLATWYRDATVRLWDVAAAALVAELPGVGRAVWDVRFLSSGEMLTVFFDGTARLSKSDNGEDVLTSEAHYPRLHGFDASLDGKRLIAMTDYPTVEIRSTRGERPPLVKSGGRHFLLSVALTHDGQRAAIGSQDGIARILDIETGREVETTRQAGWITSVRFDRDGKTLFTGSDGGTVRIWDTEGGTQRRVLPGDSAGSSARIRSIAVVDDTSRLATLAEDGTVRIWRLFTDIQALSDFARQLAPRCLTPMQRKEFNLAAEPPAWCVTGAGKEGTVNPAQWTPKPPYDGPAWREWLVAKRARRTTPMPPT